MAWLFGVPGVICLMIAYQAASEGQQQTLQGLPGSNANFFKMLLFGAIGAGLLYLASNYF